MIRTICIGCGKQYEFEDRHAGKKSKCPSCSAVIEIPAATPFESGFQSTAMGGGAPVVANDGAPAKTSGMAIASLVLSILGFCCFPAGIIGLILGIIALKNIDNPANNLKGRSEEHTSELQSR